MTGMQSEKKGKERKKKQISAKPDLTTIYAPFREKKDVEMHLIRWQKLDFNHHHQQSFFCAKKLKMLI
jgi:hypothetical protein